MKDLVRARRPTALPAVLLAALLVTLGLVSCAAPRPAGPPRIPDPLDYSGSQREWWNVYRVDYQGERKVRQKVGYLLRRFDDKDRRGTYWILNLAQERLGFFTEQGYVIVKRPGGALESQPTGIADLDGAVQRILQVRGTLEREKEKVDAGART